MTTIKVTPGDNNDSIETYIASAEVIDDDCLYVNVFGPSQYQNGLLFDEEDQKALLRGGYQRLPVEKLVGLPVSAEYVRGELCYFEFRDIADDELEGPCAQVKLFRTNGAL